MSEDILPSSENNRIKRQESDLSAKILSHRKITSVEDIILELVQNALDANATEIDVSINFETLDIEIIDNGHGMSYSELKILGNSSYVSSKFNNLKDISNLSTFGFRGEALSNIARVSKLLIISVPEYSSLCSTLCVFNDEVVFLRNIEQTKNKILKGTKIQVGELFSLHPLRKKILIANSFDILNNVKNIFLELALLNPNVSYSLVNMSTGTELFKLDLRKNGNICSILDDLAKGEQQWENISYVKDDIQINGKVSQLSFESNECQYIFVNLRKVVDKNIFKKINSVFINGNESKTKYPGFFLNVTYSNTFNYEILYDFHKQLHNISNDHKLCFMILESIIRNFPEYSTKKHNNYFPYKKSDERIGEKTYNEKDENPHNKNEEVINATTLDICRYANSDFLNNKSIDFLFVKPLEVKEKKRNLKHLSDSEGILLNSIKLTESIPCDYTRMKKTELKNCIIISQVDKKFILVRAKNRLFIIDQHAADERVRVENYISDFVKFTDKLPNGDLAITSILVSLNHKKNIEFCVTNEEGKVLQKYKNEMRFWGIDYVLVNIQECLKFIVQINRIPLFFYEKLTADQEIIKDIILQHCLDLQEGRISRLNTGETFSFKLMVKYCPRRILELINSKACRASVKFGNPLSFHECHSLVQSLAKTQFPFICAHGRPSVIPLVTIL